MTKTALVYDWLIDRGGGERTFEAIYELYDAPIFTLLQDRKKLAGTPFADAEIHSSFLQKFPFATRCHRYFLPFYPLAIEQFDLSGYDLVLSTSHAVAKGVLTHAQQLHICYCFTPMRYAWDLTHRYLEGVSGIQRKIARLTLHSLRKWDISTVGRVDHFAGISHYIARRIEKVYGRKADVIYPPVDVEEIEMHTQKEDFHLTVSRLVPYKRVDLIAEAFSRMPDQKLVIIGDGPEMSKVKKHAGKNVEILGRLPDKAVRDYMKRAKSFVYAAEEDFGIVVVEAQAAGTPVIALGKGAVLEIVREPETGLFFKEQTAESLVDAVKKFNRSEFDPSLSRKNALRFSKERFKNEFHQFVKGKMEEFYEGRSISRR